MNNLQFRKPVRAFECEKVVVGGSYIARSRDGDAILFVAEKGTLDLQENSAELAGRRKLDPPSESLSKRRLAKVCGPGGAARDGAVTDGGGERKLFAMRIFSGVLAAGLIAVAGAADAGPSAKYAGPQAAFEQGLGAYKSGYYEIAIPALEEAVSSGSESTSSSPSSTWLASTRTTPVPLPTTAKRG